MQNGASAVAGNAAVLTLFNSAIILLGLLVSGEEDSGSAQLPVSNPDCLWPKDRGTTCANGTTRNANRTVKWHFDADSLRCLAFGYHGCGGNANRFDSVFDCQRHCELMADYGHCAGGLSATARGEEGRLVICRHSNASLAEQCPEGYRCQMLFAYGICCHNETYEIYARNYRPKCGGGAHSVQLYDEENNWPVALLGKTCADEFCPEEGNTTCHQQEIFAHCCPK